LVVVYVQSLYPEVYGAKPGFSISKLGATGAYPCQKVLAIVYCVIPQVGAEP
jgi:hypothetical protein